MLPHSLFLVLLAAVVVLAVFAVRAGAKAAGKVRVSFEVTIPANTAAGEPVCVTGNFQNWEPGATTLTRDRPDRASGTLEVEAGAALEFKFTRGSFALVEKALDCGEVPNRTATASEGLMISATVVNWADRCVPVYDTRAQKVQLASKALGLTKEFYVYTPPGYEKETARRYPALYLFRGHESEWLNKHQDPKRGGRNVIDVYEGLLAAGEVGPMILVFPGLSSTDGSVIGLATNFRAPELTHAAGIGTGRFEDYLLGELLPYVDTHFRTVATKAGRGVDGFSLGGFMSAKLAAQHPEFFATAGAFDGTHFYAEADCTRVDFARDKTFREALFDPVFGKPRDVGFAAQNNGPNLVCNATSAAMQSVHWFIQYGAEKSEPDESNFYRGQHLVQKLKEKGVRNEIEPVLEGGHNWLTNDEHMRQTLPLHWRVLAKDAAAGQP